MKRLFAAAAAFCLAAVMGYSQSDITQITLPKKINIGDTAELRYTFRSPVDFFSGMGDDVSVRDIDVKSLQFPQETEDYTITKAVLERSGLLYTFALTFIPWKTGDVDFPPFDLAHAVYGNASAVFLIDLQSVAVSSVLHDPEDVSLRPPAGPLLLPGTIYFLYAAAVLVLVLLILIIRLAVRWPAMRDSRKTQKLMRSYVRNAKELFRQLHRLEKAGDRIDDQAFCAEFQQSVRRYLDFRFGYHFTTVLTSQLMAAFNTVTAGTMTDKKLNAAEALTAVMYRMDYIRYAHDSIDSQREPASQFAAHFGEDERSGLINMVRDAVDSFEEVQQDA